jgi:hypothetical protein
MDRNGLVIYNLYVRGWRQRWRMADARRKAQEEYNSGDESETDSHPLPTLDEETENTS